MARFKRAIHTPRHLGSSTGASGSRAIFIAAVLGIVWLAGWIKFPAVIEQHARLATSYAIGIMAAYWFLERLAGFTA